MCKNVLPAYSSAKLKIKIKRVFPELWTQMYCHVFYESQCIYYSHGRRHGIGRYGHGHATFTSTMATGGFGYISFALCGLVFRLHVYVHVYYTNTTVQWNTYVHIYMSNADLKIFIELLNVPGTWWSILYIIFPIVCLYALTLYPARVDCAAATDISDVTGCWQLSR